MYRLVLRGTGLAQEIYGGGRRHRLGKARLGLAVVVIRHYPEGVVEVILKAFDLPARGVGRHGDLVQRGHVIGPPPGEGVVKQSLVRLFPFEGYPVVAGIGLEDRHRDACGAWSGLGEDLPADKLAIYGLEGEVVLVVVFQFTDGQGIDRARVDGDRLGVLIRVAYDEVIGQYPFREAPFEGDAFVSGSRAEAARLVTVGARPYDLILPAGGEAHCREDGGTCIYRCSFHKAAILKSRVLPENLIVVVDFNLRLRDRHQEIVGIEGVAQGGEVLHRQSQTHEVVPPLALEAEFP